MNNRWKKALLIVLACTAVPLAAAPILAPVTATGWGVDDNNTSTLIPSPNVYVASCPWVKTALTTFAAANASWNFTYATEDESAFVKRDISIFAYFAWVVNQPRVDIPDAAGSFFDSNPRLRNQDVGGAVFGFTYTPQGTDPVNVHFIQAYNESLNGSPFKISLDNGGGATPFYDGNSTGAAINVDLASGKKGSWFEDRPSDCETGKGPGKPPAANGCAGEGIEDYHTDVQFQVLIAVDSGRGGGFDHNVKVYGGEWWGYQYSTSDIPEPAAALLTGLGLLCLGSLRRRRPGV